MAVSISIAITQNSQSIDNNTSNVTVKVNASWTYGSYNKLDKPGYLTIDGTKYTFTSPFNTGQTTSGSGTIFTKTVNISHNSDGAKTLACSASYTSGVSSGTVTASASKVLTTIPRKSTLTVSNGTLGTAQTLTVTRKSSSFTHTITYVCGTASGTIATKSSSTSISFTPPLSLASQNTTGTSVSIKYTITTYNGNASIGSTAYTKSCTIPASVKPSCTVSVSDPTGLAGKYGAYIKGMSKLKIATSATPSHGSAIASYKVTANGATYTAANFTTGVLKSSGTLAVNATVTDKRGRSGSASQSITAIEYTPPIIIKLTVHRCNEDGTENIQGEFVKAAFSASVTALNNQNSALYTLKYKPTTESEYTAELTLDDLSGKYAVTDQEYIFPADSGSSYDVELTVTDNHNSTTRSTAASTGFALMHFGADGESLGFGKLAEYPLDIGLDTRFNNPVSGKVMGLDKLPEIPENSDLNDFMETGCFAVYGNAKAATMKNMPVARAGRLEVISATGEGIRISEWSYIRQRFTPYNSENAVWERDITRSDSNVWNYGEWYRSTLSKAKSAEVYHGQKVLWTGNYYMSSAQSIELSELISDQPNGIVLVFSRFANGASENSNYNHFFVSKTHVANHGGAGSAFLMTAVNFSYICAKYLYISDDRITGNDNNTLTGTNNGVTFANNAYVLRYVIGV